MIILCDPDAGWRSRLRTRLPSQSSVTELDDLAAVRAALDDLAGATSVLLGPTLDPQEAVRLAAHVEESGHAAAVIMFLQSLDPTVMRSALRAGVVDVLTPDVSDEELGDALARAREEAGERSPVTDPRAREDLGKVITVFSTKGGCGKSLVASNLGILIAQQQGAGVALVDLDLQSGDLAIMLQMMPGLSIYDAAQSIDRIDADALKGYLTPHDSGISLLAAPLEPSLAEAVSGETVAAMIQMLRERFAYVVVDSPAFFTDQILAAIDASDHIVLVGSLDVPSIKNLRMALNTLQQLGRPREEILTVLNRADSNVGLRTPEVEKSLGTAIDVHIPSSRDVPMSINQGAPLAGERRKSDVVEAIARLLPKLTDALPQEAAPSRGGLFARRR